MKLIINVTPSQVSIEIDGIEKDKIFYKSDIYKNLQIPDIEEKDIPPAPPKPVSKIRRNKESNHPLANKPAKVGVKTCPVCNNQYKPRGNAQQFCSEECKKKAKQNQ